MKRFGLALIASLFLLPIALQLEVRANGVPAQRGDRDRDDLIINRAVYGAGNKQRDITAPLNAEIRDGRLRIQVRNDTMGGDPARNTPKTLQIWYTFRGRQFMQILNENDFLELPGREAFPPEQDRRNLIINRALYGVGNKQHDITSPLNAEIRDGRLRVQVRNDTMGGDPARNQPKTLQVWFTFDGHKDMVVLRENDFLELPGHWAFDNRGDRDRDRDHR